jgi:hypothetical protein
MGLRDWLAKSAGVGTYGQVMGRESVKNGLALGRQLYLGHGVGEIETSSLVFKDDDQMRDHGFVPYCVDTLSRPPLEDSSDLSIQTRVCGVAFSSQCCITAALNSMKSANANMFLRSMGDSIRSELKELNPGITYSAIDKFLNLPRPETVTKVLDLDNPGTGDLFSVYLQELKANFKTVCFCRSGVLGFDVMAIPLAEDTVKSIMQATQKFGW